MATSIENLLGAFLKARRTRLDPAAYGVVRARRRTPGLRREEVAVRAGISAKWYTFLEQGRGGPPSDEVLHRLSHALALTEAEREHLFDLVKPRRETGGSASSASVSPALWRLLDALEFVPAFVKTSTWDIVAWNRAGAAALTDYGALPPERRNLLRLLFDGTEVRAAVSEWEAHARLAVATFRLETARAGVGKSARALVDELCAASPAFLAMWNDNKVGAHGEGVKRITHPVVGALTFDYATFAVDGRPDLGLVTFTPATPANAERVRSLVRTFPGGSCYNL